MRKIILIEPHADKNYSFQGVGLTEIEISHIKYNVNSNYIVQAARPFIQGQQNDWVMIEFWTNNHDLIFNAACELALVCPELKLEIAKDF